MILTLTNQVVFTSHILILRIWPSWSIPLLEILFFFTMSPKDLNIIFFLAQQEQYLVHNICTKFPLSPKFHGVLQRQAHVGGVNNNSLVCVPALETQFLKCQSLKVVTSKGAPPLSCWERWSLLLWVVNKSAFAPEGDTISSFQGCLLYKYLWK